ncbi:MAG: EthD family reductase [Croceivirga sp.]
MKTKIVLLVTFIGLILLSAAPHYTSKFTSIKEGSIKIMILYPNEEGKKFDHDYYANNHMPMVAKLFGEPLKSYTIEKGISVRTPEEPASYIAIGTFYFDQLSEYERAFGANADKILGDIPNYTNIQPIVQISEVVK